MNRDDYLREVKLAKFLKKKEEEDKSKNQDTENIPNEEVKTVENNENTNKSRFKYIIDTYFNSPSSFLKKNLFEFINLAYKLLNFRSLKSNAKTQLNENKLYMQKIEEDIKKRTYSPYITTSNYDYSYIKSKTFIKTVYNGEVLTDEQKSLYKATIDEEYYNSLLEDKKYKIL